MSGHSHWATIKHKKGAADAKKGKIFSKMAKLIMQAAREGGGDPATNAKLGLWIQKARESNMPRENIDRAVKKGTGELPGQQIEEVNYEGYGRDGVAILINAITDNKNRTISEIRSIFDRNGGSLGANNCVAWLFEKKGLITIASEGVNEDELMTVALDSGASDLQLAGDIFEITTEVVDFEKVKKTLTDKGYKLALAELSRIPKTYVDVDENSAKKIMGLMEALEEHDDVDQVFSNCAFPSTMTVGKE
ncbi:MAG: YebC/PmpR family DNA-binding transcriptional regulator [Planctomycetes bacterium]|nr:YebC/PmpR family DNA-binding transcriptional regulator [Planctomycetota bacterium]